jgi:acetoin:2,6-dichlorophenolindophenol oxidoreductase subunit alpha
MSDLYRTMRLIRRFEDAVQMLFQAGDVAGTTHLYSGQEACATGICSALVAGDRLAATYRGHGYALALGVDPQGFMDELLGRATGVCGGRAGSMNVIDLERGLMGCYGIVGGTMAAATGAALAFALRSQPLVAVAQFGDGTANQAYFAECLNFAAVRSLPAVFVCENNLYMEYTPTESVTAGAIGDRPRALGIETETVDGNDVFAVRAAAERARAHAACGRGPVFLELMTYRIVGHSRSDPGAYRKPGELEEWGKRDPLLLARAALTAEHGVTAEELDQVDAEVEAQVTELVRRGRAAPWPDPSAPVAVYAEGLA